MNKLKISCEMNNQQFYRWDFQCEAGEENGDDRNVVDQIHDTYGWLAVIASNLPSPSRLPQQNFAWYETENETIAAGWILTSLDKFSAMYV